MARIIRKRIADTGYQSSRIGPIGLAWHSLDIPGASAGLGLHIAVTLLPLHAKRPTITLYEEVARFVLGRARIALESESYLQPIAAKTERQLLSLLLERAEAQIRSHAL